MRLIPTAAPAASADNSPAPSSSALPTAAPASINGWVPAIILGWVALALLAAGGGWLSLPAPVGALLSGAGLLLAAALAAVARLPAADRPRPALAGATLAVAGPTLAAGLLAAAGGIAEVGATVLATGMAVSAAVLAMPLLPTRWVARLSLLTVGVLPAAELLRLAAGAAPAWPPAHALLPALALVLVGAALAAAGLALARERRAAEGEREQLAESLQRVTRHAERDALTNSFSRRHIIEMLGREMARTDRSGEYFCVCLMDLDHFKALNDTHGHLAGDRTLASFARRVRGELRSMDSVNRAGVPSALGRVGGEEFLVLMPHTGLKGALRVAERVRRSVNARPLDGRHDVTVSIGIAEYRGSETVGSLLDRADKALYGAKRGGRNRVHCASREGSTSQIIMPEIPRAS